MKNFFKWLHHRICHKLEHLRPKHLKETLKEHGVALLVIVVGWEIIEDILFPWLFIWLGTHIHPAFYIGAPASLLLCVHWLAVPMLWGLWIKIKKKYTAR